MRRTLSLSAPLLASAALEFLTGCHTVQQGLERPFQGLAMAEPSADTRSSMSYVETNRGGFGSTLGPILLGTAAGALIIGFGSGE